MTSRNETKCSGLQTVSELKADRASKNCQLPCGFDWGRLNTDPEGKNFKQTRSYTTAVIISSIL